MSEITSKLGRRLAYFRKLRELTQAELAEKVGLSDNFVALLESGRRAPSFGTLEKLIDVLEIDVSQLFAFQEKVEHERTEEVKERLMSYVKDMEPEDIAVLVDVADKIKRGAIKR